MMDYLFFAIGSVIGYSVGWAACRNHSDRELSKTCKKVYARLPVEARRAVADAIMTDAVSMDSLPIPSVKEVPREHRPVYPGIVEDAQKLGVSRMHLWAVLSGRRTSPGLLRRYRQLKGDA